MASISTSKNGQRTIQFVAPNGKRRSIRLGKCSKRHAEAVKVKVESLLASQLTGHALERETARWVSELNPTLADKLAKVGLIKAWPAHKLAPFLDEYLEVRSDIKVRTAKKLRTTRDYLVEFYGPDSELREITPGSADKWRLFLMSKERINEENTLRKHAQIAKQFFHAAVRDRLIDENPFAGLRSTVRPNPDRLYFVSRETIYSLMDSLPDSQWRLLLALSRFGGLRCPSEHLLLKWEDVDWSRNKIRITSPKTEHHPGGGSRIIPLFPELRPYLEESFELAEAGSTYLIERYRDSEKNLRTPLLRYIRRAGLEPWPKLFQNLRTSRQTELEDHFPSHVVCAWMGNSETVAQQHYLQLTEEHFAQGTSKTSALHNPVQQSAATPRETQKPVLPAQEKTPSSHGLRKTAKNRESTE